MANQVILRNYLRVVQSAGNGLRNDSQQEGFLTDMVGEHLRNDDQNGQYLTDLQLEIDPGTRTPLRLMRYYVGLGAHDEM